MPARSMRLAQRMLASSSKRALSSSTTATCLPPSAAAIRCLMTCESRDVRYSVLDRAHLGVAGGLAQEALDRGLERLVGVVHQHAAGVADGVEDRALAEQVDRRLGRVRRIAQRRQSSPASSIRSRWPSMPAASNTSRCSSRPSSAASLPRRYGVIFDSTCRRTIGANRRSRSSISISSSRSSASPSSRSVIALRVTRNRAQFSISMSGNSRSRLPITSPRRAARSAWRRCAGSAGCRRRSAP
jgi:hypothetical protein